MKNYKWYDFPNNTVVHVNMDLVQYISPGPEGTLVLTFGLDHVIIVKEQKSAYEDGGLKFL